MSQFGDDFDLPPFKEAYSTADDLEAYSRVQALERAATRVQNYVAALAMAGAKLADLALEPIGDDGSKAQRAFEALREAKVIGPSLCRRLVRAQRVRSRIEHSYLETPAGDVHRAVVLIHEAADEFIRPYRDWIEPLLV